MPQLVEPHLPVGTIRVGTRDRTDTGDIAGLARSIDEVGLLHAVVVTADGQLVAGMRRLAAVRVLGWSQVPVRVVDFANAQVELAAELAENLCRLDLSPVEAARARERRAALIAPLAEHRERAGVRPPANLAEGSGETRKVAATGTGYSGSTLDKVDDIIRVATDDSLPEPVRRIAQTEAERLQTVGTPVDAAHRRVREAEQAATDTAADQARRTARRFSQAVSEAYGVMLIDPPDIAAAIDADQLAAFTALVDQLAEFRDQLHTAWRQANLSMATG